MRKLLTMLLVLMLLATIVAVVVAEDDEHESDDEGSRSSVRDDSRVIAASPQPTGTITTTITTSQNQAASTATTSNGATTGTGADSENQAITQTQSGTQTASIIQDSANQQIGSSAPETATPAVQTQLIHTTSSGGSGWVPSSTRQETIYAEERLVQQIDKAKKRAQEIEDELIENLSKIEEENVSGNLTIIEHAGNGSNEKDFERELNATEFPRKDQDNDSLTDSIDRFSGVNDTDLIVSSDSSNILGQVWTHLLLMIGLVS